ncbi:MAG: hypothetical protein A2Y16_00025 [Tenericutes bacterium GWF2_57_13]|nr:MAG: hypothetical protein A2Y16_00025 [Tenericutes bacterium GWF2_57_13]
MADSSSRPRHGNPFTWFSSRSKEVRLLLAAFLLLLVGVIGARLILTDAGAIDVYEVKLPTQDGQWIVADLYKPTTATAAHPAPVVVVVPGFQRSKETQTNMALELARRGIVVFCIDPYAQGDSSSSFQTQSATTEGYGLIPLVEYIYSTPNLNYIDKSKIGATGHSAGGNAAIRAAAYFGTEAIDGTVDASKLSAIYVSGYVLTLTDSVLSTIRSNVGIDFAWFDEGAYRNELAGVDGVLDADMSIAPEAIRTINSGLALNDDPLITSVDIGRIYGSPYNHTMRIVHNVRTLHSFQPYTPESTAKMIEYFEIVFELDFSIASSHQTYLWKEVFQGLMLVGGFLFVFGFGGVLLRTRFFGSIKRPLPERSPRSTRFGAILFWTVLTASAVIACFIYVPMSRLAQTMFPEAQNAIQTWVFPERMTNAVLLWAVLSGSIGFILFFGVYFLYNRRRGATLDALRTTPVQLAKTILLALVTFTGFYLLDYLCYHLFHVDFRFFLIAARPLNNPTLLIVALMYIPFFFIFYLSNSVRVNLSMRFVHWSEFKSTLVACLANSVGLLLILAIQYVVYFSTGTVHWTDEWLYVNIIFGLLPMMFILPIFNRFFFNRSGSVYAGAMISCFIFIMMTLNNSICYFPI